MPDKDGIRKQALLEGMQGLGDSASSSNPPSVNVYSKVFPNSYTAPDEEDEDHEANAFTDDDIALMKKLCEQR